MNAQLPHSMLQFGAPRRSARLWLGAILSSNRFTLGGALLLGIVMPELVHPFFAADFAWARLQYPLEPGLYASIVALIVAHLGLRRIGALPFVDDKVLVLLTFSVIYAAIGILIAGFDLHIGRYHLVMSFLIGVEWYFLLSVLRSRYSTPKIAIVGSTLIDADLLTSRVEWVHLASPRIPRDVLGIVYDSSHEQSPAWERFFARAVLRNIPVYDLDHLREMMTGRVRLRSRPELVFGQLLPSQPYLRLKRVIDTVTVVPALVLAMPIMAFAALLIRLESPGPALFVQRRVGYQGRIFNCYKLRSMRADVSGPSYTAEADPRITRVGRFIRKWRIDELPQLLNILKGEMSWIGPRPEAFDLSRGYQRQIPYYAYRHAVLPGISGWAAVHQGNVALKQAVSRKLEYDFYYIKYFSVWLDLLIVLMTLRTIVTGFGSR